MNTRQSNHWDSYGVFAIATYIQKADSETRDLDSLWDEAIFLYNRFIASKFNDANQSELDCIYQFLNTPMELEQESATENALVVNNAIAELKAINVDAKTMQFIIESLGMNDQMLKQLIMDNPESDIKDLLQEKVSLSDQRLQSIQESKLITTYLDGQQVYEGDKFVNQCDITNEGMNEGWIVGNGDMYIKYESDAVEFCKSNYNMTLQEAYDNELIYWTEWDIVDCDEFCYQIENGQLIEIEF